MFLRLPSVLFWVSLAAAGHSPGGPPIRYITPSQWNALNSSVGGRLHVGIPVARPCFTLADTAGTLDASECTAVRAGYTNNFFLVDKFGAYMNTQWGTCQSASQTCLLRGSNTTDTAPSSPPNVCEQGSVSPRYIDVRSESDVQKAFLFSKNTGVPLVVKNTGHDYKGRSSAPNSLALWTHNLKTLSYNASFVPAGCPASDAKPGGNDGGLWLTTTKGADTTVGASGGWLQGGGHGALANTLGLGVDRVLEFKIVTPTGRFLTANACQNTDLFWALRGGGGGTFGVVLESTTLASPKMTLQVAFAAFSRNNTGATRGLYEVLAENSVRWAEQGFGGYIEPFQALYVTPKLNSTEAATSMLPLFNYVNSLAPNDTGVQVLSFQLPSYAAFYQTFLAGGGAPVGENAVIGSRLIPAANFADAARRKSLVDALVQTLAHSTFDMTLIATTPYNVPDDGTTSVTKAWRTAIWHVVAEGGWDGAVPVDESRAAYSGVSTATDFLRAITPDAAYQNEADVHEPNHEVSFWGTHYPRLLQIKKKYDPENLLMCWHCVGYDPNSPRFSCYL
ncbi:FAD-binding domain-containing protein [Mycena rebaudengoi]|nr:FAD-binding domain-containing protein [Mycena rebaudengoi]